MAQNAHEIDEKIFNRLYLCKYLQTHNMKINYIFLTSEKQQINIYWIKKMQVGIIKNEIHNEIHNHSKSNADTIRYAGEAVDNIQIVYNGRWF